MWCILCLNTIFYTRYTIYVTYCISICLFHNPHGKEIERWLPGELKMKHWAAVWGPDVMLMAATSLLDLVCPNLCSKVYKLLRDWVVFPRREHQRSAGETWRWSKQPTSQTAWGRLCPSWALHHTPETRQKSDKISSWFKGSSPAPVVKI